MINITQETIDALKAQGKRTDYLEGLLKDRQLKQAKSKPVDLFTETIDISDGLREISPEETAQIQIFGRTLTETELETFSETRPHLVDLYEREI